MPSLRTTSRVLSLAADPALNRATSNIFVNEPTSGSLARSKGSLYIVTESEHDDADERAYCRLIADSVRSEYYRDPTQELDQALSQGMDRGAAKMLKDERIPPDGERPVVAVTCLAIRDGEMAIAQTLPVQTYIGTRTGIALVPDPPFWEQEPADTSTTAFFGFAPQVSFQLYSAKLGDGDIVAVCSSALAQSLSTDRLEQWLTGGETRTLTQGMRTNYLRSDTEPAYALVIQARPDVREKAGSPVEDEARAHAGAKLPFAGALPLGGVLARLGQAGAGSVGSPRPPAGQDVPADRRPAGPSAPRAANAGPSGPSPTARRTARPGRRSRPDGALANRQLLKILAVVIVAIIVVVLVVKGVQHFQASREHSAFLQVSSQVDSLLAAAAQQQDPTAATTTLTQARDLVQHDGAQLSPADHAALLARVNQRVDLLAKAGRLGGVKVLADLSGDPLAELAQVVVQGGSIYVLDTGGKRVLKVPVGGGAPLAAISAGIKVGPDTIQPLVAIATTSDSVLAVDSKNVLWAFDPSNNQIRRVPVPGSDAWGDVRSITTYKNDLYVLDTKLSRIWRYTPQGSGYGTPADLLAAASVAATPAATATPQRGQPTATPVPQPTPAPPLDLSHSVDLSVDGSVYILQSDGSVLKYLNGLAQPFPETGLVGTMPSPSQITASVSDSSVYVVDPSGKRIVRFSDTGQFQRQYLLPTDAPKAITGIQSAEVDAAQGLVYFVSDKTVAVATLPNQ
jgi:hypothetical protein